MSAKFERLGTLVQVAVGDHDGVLQVFSVKKQEISHVFKSLPTGPITRLELGGALGTVKDKVRPWVVQIYKSYHSSCAHACG